MAQQSVVHVACKTVQATVAAFRQAQDDGLVRLVAEREQEHPWDVYGIPDDAEERRQQEHTFTLWGVWCVAVQVWDDDEERWSTVDSVGQCAGYCDPLDPAENDYVPGLMAAALAQVQC